jgi:hypothetical protein
LGLSFVGLVWVAVWVQAEKDWGSVSTMLEIGQPTLTFRPNPKNSSNYSISPSTRQTHSALAVILAYGSLPTIAKAALERGEYGETDRGLGLEYPTRTDRADQVRIWYWEWRERKGKSPKTSNPHRLVTRKFHIPESLYLAVLVGVLEARGYTQEAQAIRAAKPLADVNVQYIPHPYSQDNYQLQPHSTKAQLCLHVALCQRDLARTRQHARKQSGFAVQDESWLMFYQYRTDETLTREWRFENGTYTWHSVGSNFQPQTSTVSETMYLHILEQLLFWHGLETVHSDTASCPELRFVPRAEDAINYKIAPHHRQTLEVMLSWYRLEQVAEIALQAGQPYKPKAYINLNGIGAEWRDDDVLLHLNHTTQMSVPKPDYLAVLSGVLYARGLEGLALELHRLMNFTPEVVVWQPNPYWQRNYQMMPFDLRVWDCLEMLFCRGDIQKARDEARLEQGFEESNFGVEFGRDGTVRLRVSGRERVVSRVLYLAVLEQVLGFVK